MKRSIIAGAGCAALFLAGCTSSQIASGVATATKYQQDIANACAIANASANDPAAILLAAAVPDVGSAVNLVKSSCTTEAALANLALNPLSVAWVGTLNTTIKSGGKVVPPAPVAP